MAFDLFIEQTPASQRETRLTNIRGNVRHQGRISSPRSARGELPRSACRGSINTNGHLRPVTPARGEQRIDV